MPSHKETHDLRIKHYQVCSPCWVGRNDPLDTHECDLGMQFRDQRTDCFCPCHPSGAELLVEAARLITRTQKTLDRTEQRCEHCGVTRNLNWTEARIHTALVSINGKLNKLARQLQGEE